MLRSTLYLLILTTTGIVATSVHHLGAKSLDSRTRARQPTITDASPSNRLAKTNLMRNMGDYVEREIAPSTWACACYDRDVPNVAHEQLLSYRSGNNEQGMKFDQFETFPLMRILHEDPSKDKLCLFMDPSKICYPPKPKNKNVTTHEITRAVKYGAIDMWGLAADDRYDFFKKKLTKGIENLKAKDKFDFSRIYLNYYDDHRKEVRVNINA